MNPRRDPETVPVAVVIQVLSRRWSDQYGNERHGKCPKYRPFQTRNGCPVRLYEYRGTGYCMTAREAELALTGTVNEANYCQVCDD